MRFWHIALAVFGLSLAVSTVNTMFFDTGIYDLAPRLDTGERTAQYINETVEDMNASIGQVTSASNDVWSFLYNSALVMGGIWLFVETIGNATVLLPYMLYNLYIPAAIAWTISAMVWIVYGMAIFQILTNRMTKGAE